MISFLGGQIVQYQHTPVPERWSKLGFDISIEKIENHRTLDRPRGIQSITAQGGDQGLGVPDAQPVILIMLALSEVASIKTSLSR